MRNLYNETQPCGLFNNAVSFPECIIIDMPATIRSENVFLLQSKKKKNMMIKTHRIIILPVFWHWCETCSVTNLIFFISTQYVCSACIYYHLIALVNIYKTVTLTCFGYCEQSSSGSVILKTKNKVVKCTVIIGKWWVVHVKEINYNISMWF